MKKISVLAFVIWLIIQPGCSKMDATYKQFLDDGPITYSQRVDSVKVYSGRNRVLVTWRPVSDPRVTKVNIFWSGDSQHKEVPISSVSDTSVIIDQLTEGNYVFDFYTYDDNGNHSVKVEALGAVYDTLFEKRLTLRGVNSIESNDHLLEIKFKSMLGVSGYINEEIVYTSALDGLQKNISLAGTDSLISISDFSGEGFTHRSVYKPQSLSPDLFYSASQYVVAASGAVAATYTNAVFTPILADPTVMKDPVSGYYYAYGTEDKWSTDNKNHIVPIVRSADLVSWSYVGDAFTTRPSWKSSGGIWAPDIAVINGKYYLYYACSTWGDDNPGIGLAISSFPTSGFVDQGKLFLSSEIGVPNSIDPFYFEDGGKKYLFWGSFSTAASQGTYGVELSDDGTTVKNMNEKFKIAAGDWEAVNLFKKNGYYYFFGSKGSCCEGASSTYHVRVARATSLAGPYLDKDGNDIAERGNGTIVLQKNALYIGPGHNARVITDKKGDDWILYHAMNANNPVVDNVNQRALLLDKINWDTDGWPLVNDGTPSVSSTTAPVF